MTADPHVVGHDIEDESQPALAQRRDERPKSASSPISGLSRLWLTMS